jgi:hypothetical protein
MPLVTDPPRTVEPLVAEASLPPAHEPHSLYVRVFTVWGKIRDRSYLSIKEFLTTEEEEHLPNYDKLVQLIDDAHYDRSDFGKWVFQQAALFLSEVPASASATYNIEWSHAASHLLRGSALHPRPHRSLLDDADLHPAAEILLSRAVEFCERSESLGTTAVTLNGIIATNLREWSETGDITSFYFRPACLRSARFLELLSEAAKHEAASASKLSNGVTPSTARATTEQFCLCKTPTDFLEWLLLSKKTIPLRHLAAPLETILRIHRNSAGTPMPLPPITADLFASPQLEPTREYKPGVFIDVFGTLIIDGSPNQPLVNLMQTLLRTVPTRPIYLVSDTDPDDIQPTLSVLPRPLPPVVAKSSLEGLELECLIDNDEPDPQGLTARRYLTPQQAVNSTWSD